MHFLLSVVKASLASSSLRSTTKAWPVERPARLRWAMGAARGWAGVCVGGRAAPGYWARSGAGDEHKELLQRRSTRRRVSNAACEQTRADVARFRKKTPQPTARRPRAACAAPLRPAARPCVH